MRLYCSLSSLSFYSNSLGGKVTWSFHLHPHSSCLALCLALYCLWLVALVSKWSVKLPSALQKQRKKNKRGKECPWHNRVYTCDCNETGFSNHSNTRSMASACSFTCINNQNVFALLLFLLLLLLTIGYKLRLFVVGLFSFAVFLSLTHFFCLASLGHRLSTHTHISRDADAPSNFSLFIVTLSLSLVQEEKFFPHSFRQSIYWFFVALFATSSLYFFSFSLPLCASK